MAFEKAKVIKAAEKFLAQGKINAAIKEYRQIIEHDDDDLTTLNMLGDLLARAGQKDEAAACFLRIAEHFREQEFRLKAIAMYRKIEKLKPRDPVIAKELGDLYAAQGLIADARVQYLVVADAYTRSGESKRTLEVLHQIADLDPHNTDIRLKLADGYIKERMPAEAAKAYAEAAGRLFENGQYEKSLSAYSKALELRPHDRAALKGLVSAHCGLGTPDDAAELLEKAVADTPDDLELIDMLAQAHLAGEDGAGAERAVAMMMAQDASSYRSYIAVGRLYLKLGQEEDASRILSTILEPMLAAREESDLLELVNELLARDPEHVANLRMLARIHWWQRDMEKLRAVLERLAEAAQANELVEDERYALTQLLRLAPEEQHYRDRLNLLGGFLEEVSDGANLVDDQAVPSYDSFAIVEGTQFETPAAPAEPAQFEWNSVTDDRPSAAGVSFADLNETAVESALSAGPDSETATPPGDGFASGQLTGAPGADSGVAHDTISPEKAAALMRQELESVDFYITQGYSDIAVDTLDLLERQFGSHPDIADRRARLANVEGQAAQVHDTVAGDFEAESPTDLPADPGFGEGETDVPPDVVVVPAVNGGIDSGLAEIFEEFRLEAEGESAASQEDYETHYNMATAYKEMDLLDEAIREFQTAANLSMPTDGTPRYFQCCNMLGHCFVQKGIPRAAVLWFKKGLEVPGRTGDESMALQYELGSAYEEMGDLTRAVAAFTEVYGVNVSYRDVAKRLESLQRLVATQRNKGKGSKK